MFDKIKRLGTETAIYGVSTVLGRFLTFLLTPLYANILPPGDVGVIATVYAYIAFLNVIYSYGMDAAFMKYRSTLELGSEKETFSVPFTSVAVTSLLFSAFIVWQSEAMAGIINLQQEFESIVIYAAVILCLDAVALVPFAALRMARKPGRFAAIKLVNIIVNVGCNVLLLGVYDMGVEGVFLSGIISSAFTLILLSPTVVENISFRWRGKLLAALLQFGVPYIPAGLASMMIQVIDRPILEALTDQATVGVYQTNYRLGVFMMLIVSMFDFAWRPFFLLHANDPDAKKLFARVLTYFILLMVSVFLFLTLFIDTIVKAPVFWGYSIVPEAYWGGLGIVPVVLLAYMFLGVSNTLVAGIYIEKKTRYLPLVSFVGAFVNVASNFALIPFLGMMGAAMATLMSYLVMALTMYVIVQRFYRVQYELGRITKIGLAASIVYGLYVLVSPAGLDIGWKFLLLISFVLLIYAMRFLDPAEFIGVKALFVSEERQPTDIPPDTEV